jgi:hypothetical protein
MKPPRFGLFHVGDKIAGRKSRILKELAQLEAVAAAKSQVPPAIESVAAATVAKPARPNWRRRVNGRFVGGDGRPNAETAKIQDHQGAPRRGRKAKSRNTQHVGAAADDKPRGGITDARQ